MADSLKERVAKLGLYGILSRWEQFAQAPWLEEFLTLEEEERARRSLARRIKSSRIGHFKPLSDFDWDWPERIDRDAFDQAMTMEFIEEGGNLIFLGPTGVGKTTLAQNLAHKALLAGYTVLKVSASEMLRDLASRDSASALTRRIRKYVSPALLLVDEIGFLSYQPSFGDLFFEVVSQRHETKSMVITTNRPFGEWNQIFPNSTCVGAIVDRLVHKALIVQIEGKSYRLKEAQERNRRKAKRRKKKGGKGGK